MKRRRGQAAAPKAGSKDLNKLDTLFNAYKSKDDEFIGPEGVEKLCADLGLQPTDRKVLLLAWKMGAQRMGFFSREEFKGAFAALGAATLPALKKALPSLAKEVEHPHTLEDFYRFAFDFCLTEPGQKIIDMETAAQMLQLVLPGGRFVEPFSEFLVQQKEYKKLNRDQWLLFLRFSREVQPDLSRYEDNPAYPVLLDNFVEWYRPQQQQKQETSNG